MNLLPFDLETALREPERVVACYGDQSCQPIPVEIFQASSGKIVAVTKAESEFADVFFYSGMCVYKPDWRLFLKPKRVTDYVWYSPSKKDLFTDWDVLPRDVIKYKFTCNPDGSDPKIEVVE